MSIIRRALERRQWAPEPLVPPFPGYSPSGSAPTVDRALQVSGVWACVRLLADAISMMPLEAYTMQGGIRVPAPAPSLILNPSGDATTPEWLYMVMVSLMLRGNTYGRITRRDSLGVPVQIDLLHPDKVKLTVDDKTGALVYRLDTTVIPSDQIMHIRAYRFPGLSIGLSPIQYAARSINTDEAVAQFAYGFFNDGAHPSAVLSTDYNLTQEQAKTAKDRFVAAVTGREPAVLSGGMSYAAIQVSPEESQFLATQKWGLTQIARVYGVPPEMIGGEAGNSMTYSNVEQRSLDFLTYSIQPWLTRLESFFSTLLPGRRHVRFNTEALTRTDFQTLMMGTAIGIASKQMTPDEARELRDEPPLTQAQKDLLDLIPLEVTPVGKPKSISQSAPPNVDFQNPADENPTPPPQ